jgi:hypothetical protein
MLFHLASESTRRATTGQVYRYHPEVPRRGSSRVVRTLPREMIMKRCPFCAEEIQDDAIKCKHCSEFLVGSDHPRLAEEKIQWYFRKSFIFIAVSCVGPLALPLIWFRPQTTRAWKIGLTIGILVLSWILFQTTMESIRTLKEYFKLIEGL